MQCFPKSSFLLVLLVSLEVSCKLHHRHRSPSNSFHGVNRGPGIPSSPYRRQSPPFTEDGGGFDTGVRQNENFQLGPFNFIETLPKAMEIFGLGCLWIRSLSVSTGIPYVYPILLPPLFVLVIGILFLPNQALNFENFVREVGSTIG